MSDDFNKNRGSDEEDDFLKGYVGDICKDSFSRTVLDRIAKADEKDMAEIIHAFMDKEYDWDKSSCLVLV